jgi:hypothetical protein
VATKAYLPVGFKLGDFGHLSEGSYCFCTKCRKRLFPKRSQQEKDEARLERQRAKQASLAAAFAAANAPEVDDEGYVLDFSTPDSDGDDFSLKTEFDEEMEEAVAKDLKAADDDRMTVELQVDELEVESVDVEDIKAEGVKLSDDDDDDDESCALDEDDES